MADLTTVAVPLELAERLAENSVIANVQWHNDNQEDRAADALDDADAMLALIEAAKAAKGN